MGLSFQTSWRPSPPRLYGDDGVTRMLDHVDTTPTSSQADSVWLGVVLCFCVPLTFTHRA